MEECDYLEVQIPQ